MCNIKLTPAQKAKLTKANRLITSVMEETNIQYLSDNPFSQPFQIFNYLRTLIGYEEKEVFAVMFLDNQYRLIQGKVVFTGTINCTNVYAREVVKEALLCNAAALIVSHNHPSGNLEASQSDMQLTRKLQQACKLMEVRLLDHLIVSAKDYHSMRENFEMEE
ncbi:JAB domain-containing protein [Mannheimia haemolytica]|uniref:JAB domain-containing protein n=1 Tax=Mannheimia haemolytica TaxID=75985 RepID=UPI00201C3675|nr:DNA repair protein RadC [Mannheimia haemolytica]UQX70848.1 DNA repair protein RadC [Mannheimia haemolytica]